MSEKTNYSIEIVKNSHRILENLQIGINISVLKDFHEFILTDLNSFNTRSFLLKKDENLIGHVLVYHDNKEVLYFGFFKIKNHIEEQINYLIKKLINYARQHGFKFIRGPINIPTFIYGWGFMERGSKDNLFIGKPVNPPIYQKLFLKSGFYIDTKQGTWEGPLKTLTEEDIEDYDFNDYEIYQPKDWNEALDLKMTILTISARNLASESQITPNPLKLFENIFNFAKKYGELYMLNLLKYKPTKKYVGGLISLPNPLRRNNNGKYDSFINFSFTIDKQHRGKGVSRFLLKEVFDKAYSDNKRYLSAPIEINRNAVKALATKKAGLKHTRTHLILEIKI